MTDGGGTRVGPIGAERPHVGGPDASGFAPRRSRRSGHPTNYEEVTMAKRARKKKARKKGAANHGKRPNS